MSTDGSSTVEVVRGGVDPAGEQELLAFWERRAGFGGDSAHDRLAEVVCLLRRDGRVAGSSSVYGADLEFVGGRRFLVFRCLLEPGLEDLYGDLLRATFDVLDAEAGESRDGAEGICALLDADQRRRRPEAEWRDPRMVYAGYLTDGRQVRLGYFSSEVSSMGIESPADGWRAPPGYRLARFDQQDAVTEADVISAWTTHARMPRAEAERRLSELDFVAIDRSGALVGICTAYLTRNDQLRSELWQSRALVLPDHRRSRLAITLLMTGRDHLIERFVTGEDPRGLGFLWVVENEDLRRHLPKGLWYETDVLLIGENDRGEHVRVHYFPGVHAPEPAPPGPRPAPPPRRRASRPLLSPAARRCGRSSSRAARRSPGTACRAAGTHRRSPGRGPRSAGTRSPRQS